MRSSFLGLEVSKRTIQLAQKALDITGNNLANVNTEGYTRQRVDISSMYLNKYTSWQTRISRMSLAGQGATAYGVNQVRDSYIDKRYRESACFVAEYSTSSETLEEVETVLDNFVSEGLPTRMDKFADALKKYAEQPDSEELASIVRNEAYNITNLLHNYQTELVELRESNLEALNTTMDNTNRIIKDIVDMNKKIVKEYSVMATGKLGAGESVTGSYGPNEMLDTRNLLIDELAYMGNITVYDNPDGSVRILMDGVEIINGEKYEQIYMRGSTKNVSQEEYTSELLRDYYAYDAAVLRWTSGDIADPSSGELKSYINILNGNGVYNTGYQNDYYGIPYYESTIDAFANDFANYMNFLNGAVDEEGNVINAERLMFCTKEYNEKAFDSMTSVVNEKHALNLGAFESNEKYAIRVDFRGITKTIEIKAGVDATETASIIQDALDTAFENEDVTPEVGAAGIFTLVGGGGNEFIMTAENIRIAESWLKDATMVGEVFNETNGKWELSMDGNHINEMAVKINTGVINFGGKGDFEGTTYDYLLFISNRLGQDIDFNKAQYDSAYDTTNALLDSRDAVSGVNSDEEGINMLTYQNWYSASSRMMTTLDEALDKLINSTGRVGL